MSEPTVGRYPVKLLLDILSDGMDWSARGFWAQIERYKWYWWYVCDESGEPDIDKVNPDLTPDTVLISMRDIESYDDVYISIDNKPLVQHCVENGDLVTVCGIRYDDLPDIGYADGSVLGDKAWYADHDVDYEVKECSMCIPWTDITLRKLAFATDWALENYNHLYSWHTNNEGIRDDIGYDAIGADVIIQKIVLGEVVYG